MTGKLEMWSSIIIGALVVLFVVGFLVFRAIILR